MLCPCKQVAGKASDQLKPVHLQINVAAGRLLWERSLAFVNQH